MAAGRAQRAQSPEALLRSSEQEPVEALAAHGSVQLHETSAVNHGACTRRLACVGKGEPQPSRLLSRAAAGCAAAPCQAAVPGSPLSEHSVGVLRQRCRGVNSLLRGSEAPMCVLCGSPVRLSIHMSPMALLFPLGCCSGSGAGSARGGFLPVWSSEAGTARAGLFAKRGSAPCDRVLALPALL